MNWILVLAWIDLDEQPRGHSREARNSVGSELGNCFIIGPSCRDKSRNHCGS
jgi:hypothetical protein